MSNILNKATAKVEELLHKHNSTSAPNATHPNASASHTGATHQGHSHGDPTGISSSNSGFGTTGHSSSANAGPHNSNVGNKIDPHVDSDRDGRAARTGTTGLGSSTATGTGYGTQHATGTPSASGYGANENIHSSNHGPHSSNVLNKVDPRVDSDRDASRTAPGGGDPSYGAPGAHAGTSHTSTGLGGVGHNTNHTSTLHAGTGVGGVNHGNTQHSTFTPGTTGTTGYGANENVHSSNHGPHSSNVLNKVDPRVDSDRDASRTAPGGGDPSYGAPGAHGQTGTAGGLGTTQHSSTHSASHGTTGLGNDRTVNQYGSSGFGTAGTTGTSSYTPGSGNASKTAGPHDSNLLNKLDPRVDSDRDGSKTTGGNATYR